MQPLLEGERPEDWRTSMYYRYWEDLSTMHKVSPHYGVRTSRHKLIYYHWQGVGSAQHPDGDRAPEWELFDLEKDPRELRNVYHDPAYAHVVAELAEELERLQREVGDTAYLPLEEADPSRVPEMSGTRAKPVSSAVTGGIHGQD